MVVGCSVVVGFSVVIKVFFGSLGCYMVTECLVVSEVLCCNRVFYGIWNALQYLGS